MNRTLLALLLMVAVPSLAHAYVQTRTSTGTPVAWRAHCPELTLDATPNPDITAAQLRSTMEQSAKAWNDPTRSCNNPQLVISSTPSTGRDVAFDGVNLVLWRLPGFCDDPAHQQDDVCASPDAAAVTTVFFVDKPGDPKDGELLETDMEINAVTFKFATDGSPDRIDLANTLTHELGHVLGLDHTCVTVPGAAPVLDAQGKQVPSCFPLSGLSQAVTTAAMFNFESPGEIDKRVPTDGETQGICQDYAQRTATCEDDSQAGCSVAPGRQVAFPLGVALVLALGLAVAMFSARRDR